jgi:hypothetical protein
MLVVLPSWLTVALPLVGGGILALALSRRFALVPGQIVAASSLVALFLLADAAGGAAALGAQAVAVGAAAGALLAPDLEIVYLLAVLASAASYVAVLVDPGTGPAGTRTAGRWLVLGLLGDLGLLAAAAGVGGSRGLVLAGVVRLSLFPFQTAAFGSARVAGRGSYGRAVVGVLLGVGLLARAELVAGQGSVWVLWLAALTASAGIAALWRAHSYPDALARSILVDTAHVAAGLAAGTPLSIAAGLLYAMSAALARTTLLGVADATSERGRQSRRLPDGPALIPFGLGFGGLVGMPPQPGFVARWILYLALFQVDAWPAALVLAAAATAAFAVLLREVGALGPPAQPRLAPQPLLLGLLLVWLPLGLFLVAPIVTLNELIAPAIAVARPDQSLSLGPEFLLGVPSVLALLLTIAIVLVGFALYVGRVPRVAARAWRLLRSAPLAPLRRTADAVALVGLPLSVLDGLGALIADGVVLLLEPWEARFHAVGLGAVALAMLLLALG